MSAMVALGWVVVLLYLGVGVDVSGQGADYTVPAALVEPIKPKGIRVSIPDAAGVEMFAFHGTLNKPLVGLEGGKLSRDVTRAVKGRWTYENPSVVWKAGDKLHYWLYVQYDGTGYRRTDQQFVFTAEGASNSGGACRPTNTTVRGKPACAGALLFSDDFNSLDLTKWQHDVRMPQGPDWEFASHGNAPEAISVERGELVIRPVLLDELHPEPFFVSRGTLDLEQCTGKVGSDECVKTATGGRNILQPVVTGRIRSKNAFSFKFGRVEMRVKLPAGDWLFPELWLSPQERNYGADYESGQVRLAFARGNANLGARLGAHIGNRLLEAGVVVGVSRAGKQPIVKRHVTSKLGSEPWANNFHNYSVTWTPDDMTFSVDGTVYASVVPPAGGFKEFPEFAGEGRNPWAAGGKMAPFDKELYLRIGLGVGGIRAFPDNSTSTGRPKPWRNSDPKMMALFWKDKDSWYPSWTNSEMRVDSVRVYAL